MQAQPLMPTYARLPVTFTHGEGAWLYDAEGNRYLDALAGIAVCGLGHAHPAVTRTISEQAAKLIHTSNLYGVEAQEALGRRLVELTGMTNVFFSNSGAEANEAAIKLARLYGHKRGIERPEILVMDGAFHGRTLATLSATANKKVQEGFGPLVEGFVRVPFNDLDAVRSAIAAHPDLVAIMLEPIQGEGGLATPAAEYLPGLRALCDEHDLLLICDEIQTGNGRTGSYFAFQDSGIIPDVLTTAKGLGNGLPIGACLAHNAAAELFGPGNHGSTFGGNPLACAVGLTVVDTILGEHLCERATEIGTRIRAAVAERYQGNPALKSLRGKGAMIGIELDRPCAELVQEALKLGLLINVTAGCIVRLLPPLNLSDAELDELIKRLSQLLDAFIG